MAPRACLLIALAAVASADAVCSELGTCTDAEALEETPAVSMLQTEMHVNKGTQSSTHPKVAETAMTAKQTRHVASASEASTFMGVTLGLLAVACLCTMSSKRANIGASCVAEFLGTFMLIFSIGCNVLVGDKTWGVTSIASTLMVSIYALGGVSGANFNPAVSLALGLLKVMAWVDVITYICVQLAAGILAALAYGLILGQTTNLAPAKGFSWFQAGIAELLYTFMLVFVVLNVAVCKKHSGKNQFYGLAIGFVIVAGGYGAGSISGGCFNPAVALGLDASNAADFGGCLYYIAFQIIGCVAAAALYHVCRADEFAVNEFGEPIADVEITRTSKFTSEFLGTFILVLTVGLNVLSESKAGVFSIAASLMCMIFALGSCSGAHFNPAVTAAIACSGRDKIDLALVPLYITAQVVGGISAAITYAFLMNGKTVPLAPKTEVYQALTGELIFTFLLCFVVLTVATTKSVLSEYFGLAIGACVIAGGYAIGSLSGGSLNPAVTAGLGISDGAMNNGPIEHMVSYAAVEVIGGVLAAGIFRMTHSSEYVEAKEGL